MKFYRIMLFSLLLCFVFPLVSNAAQIDDAKTAIKNKDFTKAQKLLAPLAEENNAEAENLLGALYVNGQGVEKDPTKGLQWIMKSATQGFEPAKVNAFNMCLNLAKKGNTSAMYNVGYMCLNGWGGKHDSKVCLKWLETAGKLGHERSAKVLSMIYRKGMFGITPDVKKAAYWNNLPAEFAEGIDGKWKGSIPMEKGGRSMDLSFNFKTDGNNLTGTTVGNGKKKIKIKDGKIDGNKFSFEVEANNMGRVSTTHYAGIFMGDTLKLTLSTDFGAGNTPPVTFVAKRVE